MLQAFPDRNPVPEGPGRRLRSELVGLTPQARRPRRRRARILPVLHHPTSRGLSFWDSRIVAPARLQGCAILLTEDMSHGQEPDGLRAMTPSGAVRKKPGRAGPERPRIGRTSPSFSRLDARLRDAMRRAPTPGEEFHGAMPGGGHLGGITGSSAPDPPSLSIPSLRSDKGLFDSSSAGAHGGHYAA